MSDIVMLDFHKTSDRIYQWKFLQK